MKNLLIIKGLDKDKFFKTEEIKNWDIFDIKEFVKQIKKLRKTQYETIICGYDNLNDKTLQYPIQLFFLFLKANKKYFIDNQGKKKDFSCLGFVFIETPLFMVEIIFDLFLIIFSWITLFIFNLLPKKRLLFRQLSDSPDLKGKIIYLRTDNFRKLQQGGSFTHFRGIVKGFYNLGYKVFYLGSGDIEVSKIDFPKKIIPYCLKFNLPEIPEIYYNWRFIFRAFKIIQKTLRQAQGRPLRQAQGRPLRQAQGRPPLFIYQRHSIFNVCGAVLSQLRGIPLILEYNGSEPWVRKKWGGLLIFQRLCQFMENFSLRKADLIVVVSKSLKDELIKRGITKKKILVNYNGVDPEEFNYQIDGSEIRKKLNLENKIVIGAVSTFGVWHGIPVLAKAVKPTIQQLQIPNSKFQIHFLFIGDGVERPLCERIIKEDKVENYVTFTGLVPYKEIAKYLSACDILVSPHVPNSDGTEFFGSPTKLFEYMAMGKGIVASDLDQIGEILEHKKTAWLVKPGVANDLANGIIELVKNERLREELGRNAREEVINKYTWEQNVKRILITYLNLINNKN